MGTTWLKIGSEKSVLRGQPHISKIVTEKTAEFGWELLPHPLYSPDLSPSHYHLISTFYNYLRGKNFENEEVLKIELEKFFD